MAIIYCNGTLVDGDKGFISPYDHGFLYGHGLFETLRIYEGTAFRLADHLERLEKSAAILGWDQLPSRERLEGAVNSAVEANGWPDAMVRLTLSRGKGAARPDPSTCKEVSVVVFVSPYQETAKELFSTGFRLMISSLRRNEHSPLSRVKSANYLECILAKEEAKSRGFHDGVMCNTAGNVAEISIGNIFAVVDGKLVTPDLASGILPGISRKVVLELAGESAIPWEEEPMPLPRLAEASEIFITNSLLEIMPVSCVEGYFSAGAVPGRTTRLLADGFRRLVDKNCKENRG